MIKKFIYFFQALIVYIFFLIAKLIGLTLSRKVFSYIFKKIGPIIKSEKIINSNLMKFSNTLSDQDRKEIKSNMWSNYGMTFVEYVFLNKFKKENLHISIFGENLLNEISINNKPVIFVSGHFANFELMSMEITKRKINLATIYRPLNNIFLNPFMEFLRKKYICKNQIKKGRRGIKEIIEHIEDKRSIALMIDQRVSEGEKVKFFNEDALTTTLPAQLAFKYNLDIIPIFIERKKDNLFEMKIYNPLKLKNYQTKNDISKKLNQILETMLKRNPHQWIWTHNRWK